MQPKPHIKRVFYRPWNDYVWATYRTKTSINPVCIARQFQALINCRQHLYRSNKPTKT